MPADFFKGCDLPLIRELVLALDMAEGLGVQAQELKGMDDLKRCLDLRDREVRRAAALARTLRISPQSRYDRHATATASNKSGANRPWLNKESPFAEFADPADSFFVD